MNYDNCGNAYTDTRELVDLLYQNPELDLSKFFVIDPDQYNESVRALYADLPELKLYNFTDIDIEKFDQALQEHWHMPDEYKQLDIAKWILDQCKSEPELQRVGQELLLFQERDAFNLLRYLKYLIDTFRTNGIVWGLGRGSSVASYVLYLIGVHKIDSIYYDLPIEEFLK